MKKILLLFLIVGLVLASCASPNKKFVEAVYNTVPPIHKKHIKYIEADKALSKDAKETAIYAIELNIKMIENEYKRVSGDAEKKEE